MKELFVIAYLSSAQSFQSCSISKHVSERNPKLRSDYECDWFRCYLSCSEDPTHSPNQERGVCAVSKSHLKTEHMLSVPGGSYFLQLPHDQRARRGSRDGEKGRRDVGNGQMERWVRAGIKHAISSISFVRIVG